MPSPLERSKAELEKQGYAVWKVERPASMWAPTLDLYNCIDLVAIRSDRQGVMGIQCCGTDMAPHIHKILEGEMRKKIRRGEVIDEVIPPNPYLKIWLAAGNTFFIWSWRPLKEDRNTRAFYRLREIEFLLDNNVVIHRLTAKESEEG